MTKPVVIGTATAFFPSDADAACSTSLPRDCDDDSVTVFPGAPVICGDGVANNCTPPTIPAPLAGLPIQEFQSISPVAVLEVSSPDRDPAVDILALPTPVPEGGEFRAVIATVREGGDLDLALYSERFRASLGSGLVEIEANGLLDANVTGVALGTFGSEVFIAVRFLDRGNNLEGVSLFQLAFQPTDTSGAAPVVPATAIPRATAEFAPEGALGMVTFGEAIAFGAGGVQTLVPAAIYAVSHGVCRLTEIEGEVCSLDNARWSSPGYTRTSGVLSVDEHVDTFNSVGPRNLIINSGIGDIDLELRNTASEDVQVQGDWDVLLDGGTVEVVVPLRPGTIANTAARFIQFTCPDPNAANCLVTRPERFDLPIRNAQIFRLGRLAGAYTLGSVEAPLVGRPVVNLRLVNIVGGTDRLSPVDGVVDFQPPTGTVYETIRQLELSVETSGDGQTIALAYPTEAFDTATQVNYFLGGLQICNAL